MPRCTLCGALARCARLGQNALGVAYHSLVAADGAALRDALRTWDLAARAFNLAAEVAAQLRCVRASAEAACGTLETLAGDSAARRAALATALASARFVRDAQSELREAISRWRAACAVKLVSES
eukprot:5920051-Pleurochrysis_carterae.AAC.1